MLLVLVFILLLIGAAVVGSIYSNFLVFYSSFHESENYHKAYYNSIIALERSELVTKQRAPGFEGSGGRILGITSGNSASDGVITSNFSYEGDKDTREKSSAFRTIKSRTTRIPSEGNGDVEAMLATDDSDNYNMMDYENTQVFQLYYDNSNGNPYKKTSCSNGDSACTQSKPSTITGIIRLPLNKLFGNLDDQTSLVTNGVKDDVIVDRQIRGKYSEDNQYYPFTIFSTQTFTGNNNGIKELKKLDNAIRESNINGSNTNPYLNFEFGKTEDHPRSPITAKGERIVAKGQTNKKEITMISPKEKEIKNDASKFRDIFTDDKYSDKQLRFSLLNLLIAKKDNSINNVGLIYPFLEYYADFGTTISDKYFTINAEGNYDDYRINIIVRKPTIKESVLGSFTTIF